MILSRLSLRSVLSSGYRFCRARGTPSACARTAHAKPRHHALDLAPRRPAPVAATLASSNDLQPPTRRNRDDVVHLVNAALSLDFRLLYQGTSFRSWALQRRHSPLLAFGPDDAGLALVRRCDAGRRRLASSERHRCGSVRHSWGGNFLAGRASVGFTNHASAGAVALKSA